MLKVLGGMCLTAAFFVVLSAADAQDGADGKGKGKFRGKGDFSKFAEERFKKLDTNSDSRLSKEEFLKAADRAKEPEKIEKLKESLSKAFDKADADKQGLTLDQYKEAQKSMFQGFRGKGKKKDKTPSTT